ncbi:MAG TPA: DUF1232 domain-containing protein [Burkholderiales bacterium]|nr:DUF1232 domain-containing protein [Burkholderiales bacterium]
MTKPAVAERLRALKRETMALYFAARDPRTPLAAKVLAAAVVAYALSPIDLIPDFIPVIGLLDDLVLLPIGIAIVLRLIPPEVMADGRARAEAALALPKNTAAAVMIVLLWLAMVVLLGLWAYRAFAAQ